MIIPPNRKGRFLFFLYDAVVSLPNLQGRIPFIKDLKGEDDALLGVQMIRNQAKV